MLDPTLHFWNAQGIELPRVDVTPMLKGLFFDRFKGLVLPGRNNSEIGRGGSGVIHLVRDTVLDRTVALKLPHESILSEPQAKHEVQHEASEALELTHPNIVRIYDFHDVNSRWGISMQYIRGKNLDEWRPKLAPWQAMGGAKSDIRFYDVERIKDWIRQLCSALSYVHEEANIVHCDIKPKNLLLERSIDTTKIESHQIEIQERLVITDFGITQKLRNHTTRVSHTKQVVAKQQQPQRRSSGEDSGDERGGAGTLAYMSPQLLAGDDPKPSDDIYAVGITIYELLTGRPPFYQGDAELIQRQIQTVVPPPVSQRRAERNIKGLTEIPAIWDEAVAACLAKTADKRPPSIAALAAMLGLSTEAAVSGSQPGASAHEVITLQTTVAEQRALIIEKDFQIEGLARRVSDTLQENEGEIQRLKTERDSVITRHDALQREVQTLDQQCANLTRQLAQLKDAQGGASTIEQLAELNAQVERFTKERAALEQRAQAAETELKTVSLSLAQTEQKLDRSEASEEKLKKDRAAAISARVAAEAQLPVFQKKLDEASEEKRLAEREVRQTEEQLKKSKAEAAGLQEYIISLSDQRSSPIKMLAFAMAGIVVIGAIGGWLMGKMSGPSIEKTRSEVVAAANAADSAGIVVTAGQFKTYLATLGLDKNNEFLTFMRTSRDDGPVTGVSWLLAASFCEWLTEEVRSQSGNADSRKWYDLPTYAELKSLPPRGLDVAEWTKDDAPATGDSSSAQGAFRSMRIFDPKAPSRAKFRDEAQDDVGFRCMLREK